MHLEPASDPAAAGSISLFVLRLTLSDLRVASIYDLSTDMTAKAFINSCAVLMIAGCATTNPQSLDESVAPTRPMHPVSQPVTFESPTIDSHVRPIVMHHAFPVSSVFQGGDLQLYALQLRYAIDDKLAIIATKDGYIDFNPDGGPFPADEGFADIAAGIKYAFVDDPERGLLVSGGLIYEIDSGDHEVFQGNGDGALRPFVSAGLDCDEINLIGSIGADLPIHGSRESQSIDYHLHADYALTDRFSPLVELHGITYTRNASALAAGFEGDDLINLGSANVSGQSVFMGAVGGRFMASDNTSIGAAYEFPLGGRQDVLDWRLTFDVVISF